MSSADPPFDALPSSQPLQTLADSLDISGPTTPDEQAASTFPPKLTQSSLPSPPQDRITPSNLYDLYSVFIRTYHPSAINTFRTTTTTTTPAESSQPSTSIPTPETFHEHEADGKHADGSVPASVAVKLESTPVKLEPLLNRHVSLHCHTAEHLAKFNTPPKNQKKSFVPFQLFEVVMHQGPMDEVASYGRKRRRTNDYMESEDGDIASWTDIARKLGFNTKGTNIAARIKEWIVNHHIGPFFDWLRGIPNEWYTRCQISTAELEQRLPELERAVQNAFSRGRQGQEATRDESTRDIGSSSSRTELQAGGDIDMTEDEHGDRRQSYLAKAKTAKSPQYRAQAGGSSSKSSHKAALTDSALSSSASSGSSSSLSSSSSGSGSDSDSDSDAQSHRSAEHPAGEGEGASPSSKQSRSDSLTPLSKRLKTGDHAEQEGPEAQGELSAAQLEARNRQLETRNRKLAEQLDKQSKELKKLSKKLLKARMELKHNEKIKRCIVKLAAGMSSSS
ncbi:uncharacterized protein BJ171DRAFT_155091 [Polychytrium aggregatum]|uniref:uncharacterized protein n=1 Tax=Polychytrium aggregatum TaxID=110093 RepID=UPI0022FE9B2D|nr:uncharacterized protein BJ171DRAFT_155091 [Polychytrium aggregatum]KAI9203228.1 hypothetical protein BJ171DRAFT_155091 [Polychytrium aggregatum]